MAPVESGEILFIDEVHEKGSSLHGRAVRVLGTYVRAGRLAGDEGRRTMRVASQARADVVGSVAVRLVQRGFVRSGRRDGGHEAQRERDDGRHFPCGRRTCAARQCVSFHWRD